MIAKWNCPCPQTHLVFSITWMPLVDALISIYISKLTSYKYSREFFNITQRHGPHYVIVRCWEFTLKLSLLAQLFERLTVIFLEPTKQDCVRSNVMLFLHCEHSTWGCHLYIKCTQITATRSNLHNMQSQHQWHCAVTFPCIHLNSWIGRLGRHQKICNCHWTDTSLDYWRCDTIHYDTIQGAHKSLQ